MLLQLAALALIVYLLWFYGVYVRKYPKGPTPLPLIGNLLQLWGKDPPIYYDQLSKTYGPIYTLFMPAPSVVLMRQEDIRECVVNRADHFNTVGVEFALLSDIPNGGIAGSNGDNWREQRRLAVHIFRDFGLGKTLMEQQIMRQTELLVESFESVEDPNHVDFFAPLQLCIGNVINRLLLGYNYSGDSKRLNFFLGFLTNFFLCAVGPEMALYNSLPWTKRVPLLNRTYKRIEEDMRQYRAFIRAEVDAQRRDFDVHAPATTFVQAYLREMETSNNPFLSVDQLYCVVSDFWAAGMESTSNFLRWAVIYAMRFPSAQRKAQEEIDATVGRDRYTSAADRQAMPYVTALIYEVYRYSSFLTITARVCESEQTVAGRRIPADTIYLFNLYSENMRIAVDGESDVHAFRPERFLEADGKTLKKDALARLIIFGIGKRRCPGEGLASVELFLILTTLLQKFTFCPPDRADGSEGTVDDVDINSTFGAIMYPTKQPCKIVRRY